MPSAHVRFTGTSDSAENAGVDTNRAAGSGSDAAGQPADPGSGAYVARFEGPITPVTSRTRQIRGVASRVPRRTRSKSIPSTSPLRAPCRNSDDGRLLRQKLLLNGWVGPRLDRAVVTFIGWSTNAEGASLKVPSPVLRKGSLAAARPLISPVPRGSQLSVQTPMGRETNLRSSQLRVRQTRGHLRDVALARRANARTNPRPGRAARIDPNVSYPARRVENRLSLRMEGGTACLSLHPLLVGCERKRLAAKETT